MSPHIILIVIFLYIGMLYLVSYFSSKNADSSSFYQAGRKAPWPLVSYGMIGVVISGITFVSVPGEVLNSGFTYFQMVFGYSIGLLIVTFVLLPVFYKKNVISIYAFLEERFGQKTHKTGAAFFLIAHLLGAAFRLYLMAYVLQLVVFDSIGIPFALTVFITIMLIWLYTHKGGIRTIIFTDVLQTTFLLLAAGSCIWAVGDSMNLSILELNDRIWQSEYSQMFDWTWGSPNNFFKLIVTGTVFTIAANGLDQAIMQKHLTCANVKDAQKNIFSLSIILLFVNMLFLFLGAALLLYAADNDLTLPSQSDQIYAILSVDHLGSFAAISFVIGIAAAAYSSADSSLTGLTTAFCIDFLGYQTHRKDNSKIRKLVHLSFSILIFFCIMIFRIINDQSIVNVFIKVSGYAYGPLLGLFAFGIFTSHWILDKWIPVVCIAAPIFSYFLDQNSVRWFGYQFGYETLVVNALFTFIGLYLLINKKENTNGSNTQSAS